MLCLVKARFVHERESKMISVGALNRLLAAIGMALDVNNEGMEGMQMAAAEAGEKDNASNAVGWRGMAARQFAAAAADAAWDGTGQNPVTAFVNSIVGFCDAGVSIKKDHMPADYFEHQMICAEMLHAVIEDMTQVSASNLDELDATGDFAMTYRVGLQRCETQLGKM